MMKDIRIVLGRNGIGYIQYRIQSVQEGGVVKAEEPLKPEAIIRIQAEALKIIFDQNLGWIIEPIRRKEEKILKLTPQQRKILKILKRAEKPLTQKEIANQMNVRPQAIWNSLQELVKEGILVRSEERPFRYSIADYEL